MYSYTVSSLKIVSATRLYDQYISRYFITHLYKWKIRPLVGHNTSSHWECIHTRYFLFIYLMKNVPVYHIWKGKQVFSFSQKGEKTYDLTRHSVQYKKLSLGEKYLYSLQLAAINWIRSQILWGKLDPRLLGEQRRNSPYSIVVLVAASHWQSNTSFNFLHWHRHFPIPTALTTILTDRLLVQKSSSQHLQQRMIYVWPYSSEKKLQKDHYINK